MDNNKDLPKRKSTRLKSFDYSSAGVYFVTICVRDRMQILSEIVKTDLISSDKTNGTSVGEGLAPPASQTNDIIQVGEGLAPPTSQTNDIIQVGEGLAPPASQTNNIIQVGEGLAPPEFMIQLKPCGEVIKEQLQLIETRFPNVTVEDYVIMPDHIHIVIFLHEKTGGASPCPTLNDVVCAFKSLTARSCKQKYGIEKMFQRSYAEHIVRDREDYETRRKYIYENPKRWYYKYLNAQELKEWTASTLPFS